MNGISKQLGLVWVFCLFSQSVFADVKTVKQLQSEFHAVVATQELRTKLLSDLTDDLQSQVLTLKRPIKVYHYGKRGPKQHNPYLNQNEQGFNHSGWGYFDLARPQGSADLSAYSSAAELNPPEASDYFKLKAGLIFGEGSSAGAAGAGLYAAVDPIQSETYAGGPWFLLEIEVPAKIRYLPFSIGFKVSEQFFKKHLKQLNWLEHMSTDDDRWYIRLKNGSYGITKEAMIDIPELKQLYQEAIHKLKIDLLAYPWNAHALAHCRENNVAGPGSQIAFNFVNPDFLKRGGLLNVYVANLEADASEQKKKYYQNLLNVIEMGLWNISFSGSYDTSTKIASKPQEMVDGKVEYGALGVNKFISLPYYLNTAFFRTFSWNSVLQRVSPWSQFLNLSPEELFGVSTAMNTHFVQPQQLVSGKLQLNLNLFHLTEQITNYNIYYRYQFDPRVGFQKWLGEGEYQKRLRQLESQTYQCDPAHPEEVIFDF
jgi:hypothetical protein